MSPTSAESSLGTSAPAASALGFTDAAPSRAELSAADAEAINSNFNLVAYGTAHGSGGVDEYGHLPEVEDEYRDADRIVNSLDPARGDVLFVEAVGYNPAEAADPSFKWSDHLGYIMGERAKRSISQGLYIELLARARGIPVVPADLTRSQVEAHNATTGQDAMVMGLDPGWGHYGSFHTLREQAVADTVTNHALAALPTLNGNKPTYAIPYGKVHFEKAEGASDMFDALHGHTPGIPAAFDRLGLKLEVEILPDAWDARRQAAMAALAGKLPDFPDAPGAA
ncbi:MAG TPA: hypothetical protein VLF71_06010 [Candidatus Saccharimonadales bacterium]|nr:hypothetical protein [Candidatus Saccharimonadales bacterium]